MRVAIVEQSRIVGDDREAHDASIFANLYDIVHLTTITTSTGEVGENQRIESENRPKIMASSSATNLERKNNGTKVNTPSHVNSNDETNDYKGRRGD